MRVLRFTRRGAEHPPDLRRPGPWPSSQASPRENQQGCFYTRFSSLLVGWASSLSGTLLALRDSFASAQDLDNGKTGTRLCGPASVQACTAPGQHSARRTKRGVHEKQSKLALDLQDRRPPALSDRLQRHWRPATEGVSRPAHE